MVCEKGGDGLLVIAMPNPLGDVGYGSGRVDEHRTGSQGALELGQDALFVENGPQLGPDLQGRQG